MTSPTDSQTPEELDRRVHLSHCYQGENLDNCKYGDEDCPAKPQTPESQDATELYELLDVLTGPPGWMADLEKLIADYTLAAQKALLERLEKKATTYDIYGGEGEEDAVSVDDIDAELEKLERQQLGKENTDG